MSSVPGRVFIVMLAAGRLYRGRAEVALAQVKPAVTTLGPDFPKSEIFHRQQLLLLQQGMPDQVSQSEAADADIQADRATDW